MMRTSSSLRLLLPVTLLAAGLASAGLSRCAHAELTLRIQDYATAPMTGAIAFPSATANSAYLARLNFMAEEPGGGGNRFFVNDLNGPLYILDKTTRQFTEYLNFNGLNGAPGLFRRFVNASGYANGFITFQFDPDYANNGKFYTVHMETVSGSQLTPVNANFPGFDTTGYATTAPIDAPGNASPNRRTVLIEWTDADVGNATFEGTARELLRVDMFGTIHPMGDLVFNPTAQPGDPDWRVMYVSIGDGGAGEQTAGSNQDERRTPQQLNAPGGKILRIIPDLDMYSDTSTLSSNGRYRIPNDNPFVDMNNDPIFGDEVYAMGFRNPHRVSWDVDPADPENNRLIVNDIGLHTWEEVNLVHAGGNYGYPQREGNQRLSTSNGISAISNPDLVTIQLNDSTAGGTVAPIYPVIQYGHGLSGQPAPEGDSITSGFVYRGQNIPSLYGKYVYGDITTGALYWSDYDEMLAADDGNPQTMAEIHFIDLLWDNPADAPDQGETLYSMRTPGGNVYGPMFDIVETAYHARGGQDDRLPGSANATGGSVGRADIRIQVDDAGELFLLSKSDGMIRYIVEAVGNGDFDGDGRVTGNDFLIWQRNLGQAGGLAQGDADGDGRVTFADLHLWRQAFAPDIPPRAAIPEPAGAGLALIALTALAAGRRRSPGR